MAIDLHDLPSFLLQKRHSKLSPSYRRGEGRS